MSLPPKHPWLADKGTWSKIRGLVSSGTQSSVVDPGLTALHRKPWTGGITCMCRSVNKNKHKVSSADWTQSMMGNISHIAAYDHCHDSVLWNSTVAWYPVSPPSVLFGSYTALKHRNWDGQMMNMGHTYKMVSCGSEHNVWHSLRISRITPPLIITLNLNVNGRLINAETRASCCKSRTVYHFLTDACLLIPSPRTSWIQIIYTSYMYSIDSFGLDIHLLYVVMAVSSILHKGLHICRYYR